MKRYYEGFSEFSIKESDSDSVIPESLREYVNDLVMKAGKILLNLPPSNGWVMDDYELHNIRAYRFSNKGMSRQEMFVTPFYDNYDDLVPAIDFDGIIFEFDDYRISNLSKRLTMDMKKDVNMIVDTVSNILKSITSDEEYLRALKKANNIKSDQELAGHALENGENGILKILITSGRYMPNDLNELAMIIETLPDKDHDIIIKHILPNFIRSKKSKNLFGV
jgi:hypothetical protein